MPLSAMPLSAVDEVVVLSPTEVLATKRITAEDPYLDGHFPQQPIYPGVFVLETVRQAAAAVTGSARLTAITVLRLFQPLTPGDTLTAHVICTPGEDGGYRVSAVCTRDGGQVASVGLEVGHG
jgi:3-hydroxyacyl-[acyl-carrier-protein] dehydratase